MRRDAHPQPADRIDALKYLKELHEERKRIDRVIAQMEGLLAENPPAGAGAGQSRRGRGRRPGMTNEERRAISERMQRYWAAKRGKRLESAGDGKPAATPS